MPGERCSGEDPARTIVGTMAATHPTVGTTPGS